MDTVSLYSDDIDRVLLDEGELSSVVDTLAANISRDYKDKNLLMLGILKGSVLFMSDLMKRITIPSEIDFMKVSSYGAGTTSSGRINIILDLARDDLSSRDILIVEDIIDSGRTLSYLKDYLTIGGAHSVSTCTLLDKPSRREVDFVPDYVGRQIPDEFVVGYGLDYDERYRTLPYVGILKREIYNG